MSNSSITKRPFAAVSSSSNHAPDVSNDSNTPSQALSLMPPPPLPPTKRIRRPSTVLDEDIYTSALSHIIARDFFPGLLETQIKQEYLDALESKDKEWIASARKKLREVVGAGRNGDQSQRARARRGKEMMRRSMMMTSGSSVDVTPVSGMMDTHTHTHTPRGWAGETPMTVRTAASSTAAATPTSTIHGGSEGNGKDTSSSTGLGKIPDVTNLSLLAFQAKYTSEDNESFNKVLDKQNAKRREKYAWLWSGNKIPSARQIAFQKREAKRIAEHGRRGGRADTTADGGDRALIKTDLDARPAKPDTWESRPENSLMFIPSSVEDTLETVQQRAEAESRAGPKTVLYQNTRLVETAVAGGAGGAVVPPSPSLSAIHDAIAGRPRPTGSEAMYNAAAAEGGGGSGETPRVNGYAFVDEDEPEPEPERARHNSSDEEEEDDLRLLGPSAADSTPNPFQIQETRRREALHHRMVDRVARNKRAERDMMVSGRSGSANTPLTTMSGSGSGSGSVPRFPSSPRLLDYGLRSKNGGGNGGGGLVTPGRPGRGPLTPAAQRLLSSVGSGGGGRTPKQHPSSSGLKNMWTPTPKRRGR